MEVSTSPTRSTIPAGESAFVDLTIPKRVVDSLTARKSGSFKVFIRVVGAGAMSDVIREMALRKRNGTGRKTGKKKAANARFVSSPASRR